MNDPSLTDLLAFASLVEARDPYTAGHLWRVSRFARQLAEAAGVGQPDVARITVGAFLHDLGKASVPVAILRKPGPLDDQEWAVLRTHPEQGARRLEGHPLAGWVRPGVIEHHERPDGAGYPHGLRGPALSVDAHIVGIADAFDAMTSARPYRRELSISHALGQIERGLGAQFDERLGRRFLALGVGGELDHVVGHSAEGLPLAECPGCGPILPTQADRAEVPCPACAAVFEVRPGARQARFAGRMAGPEELAPRPDPALVSLVVEEVADALPSDVAA